jgi:hypothetical protein
MSDYDAKTVQKKINPREIDEIISKYILYHLQQFFRDGPPSPLSQSKQKRRASTSKTAKKKGHSSHHHHHHHPNNVFYVDKTSALKNMHNKTVRNR